MNKKKKKKLLTKKKENFFSPTNHISCDVQCTTVAVTVSFTQSIYVRRHFILIHISASMYRVLYQTKFTSQNLYERMKARQERQQQMQNEKKKKQKTQHKK